jgi:hypothetical protein
MTAAKSRSGKGRVKLLNQGYTAIVKDEDFAIEAGPYIYCPKCKKPLMEAVVDRFKTRCKHCGKWVYLERKKVDK